MYAGETHKSAGVLLEVVWSTRGCVIGQHLLFRKEIVIVLRPEFTSSETPNCIRLSVLYTVT